MPLNEQELDKLCHRRIIIAKVYDSIENNFAKERPVIILSNDEQIKNTGRFRVVAISHNDQIDSIHLMPVPGDTGFNGHIIGSFAPWIEEADVKSIHGMLSVPDMSKVISLVRQADAAKKLRKSKQK